MPTLLYYISSIGSLECNFGNQIISFQNILTFFSPSRKQEIALQRSHNWNNTYQYLVHHQHKTEIKDPLIFVLKAKYVKLKLARKPNRKLKLVLHLIVNFFFNNEEEYVQFFIFQTA